MLKTCFKTVSLLAIIQLSHSLSAQDIQTPIYKSSKYEVYPDRVVQSNFVAKATSPNSIVSNYKSPANEFQSPRITFKFSLNSKDNEMISGRDHHFNCIAVNGLCETPLIEFGKQFDDDSIIPSNTYLQPNTKLNIKLDLRKVFSDFNTKGYYTTFNGEKIFKEDFKGVYVAGNTAPLSWDFDNLHNKSNLELKDHDNDHIYDVSIVLNAQHDKQVTEASWNLSEDITAYPQYTSDYTLLDALYNMSLEEMLKAIEEDSTLRTGKEWAGVWTRDVSYSIILSMAILQPKVAQHSLMRKVKDGVIIQDTGTGGAYPVSTDRMVWAVAAYEIYKVTGEKAWLKKTYPIIKKSLEDDLKNITDPVTGLVKGESSFLDWREQTYPKWMEPKDIFESECLGTNAVHYQANIVLSKMAEALGDPKTSTKHKIVADRIRQGVNTHLWLNDKKYFGQYVYGRNFKVLSPKSEALGEALCVLFDIPDPVRQKEVVQNTPVNEFGIPCLYPQIPNIPPYHNNATWPFVQSYWALAAAKAGNEKSVIESLSAIYRPSALFLTNKENFVAANGDYVGTQINSDNMLWSLSGNIGLVYKLIFGIQFNDHSIKFAPFVPEVLKGKRKLNKFKYRKAILDIELLGFGNKIKSITMDGETLVDAVIPETLSGRHSIKIVLDNNKIGGETNLIKNYIAPEAPEVTMHDDVLSWTNIPNVSQYKVIKNGKLLETVSKKNFQIKDDTYGEYQIISIDAEGYESFASEPIVYNKVQAMTFEVEKIAPISDLKYKGFSGSGFVDISTNKNSSVSLKVDIKEAGTYAIDFRYANGNGPISTENKCAIRTLSINNQVTGTMVFPQRGTGEWSDWGFSNSLLVVLKKGSTQLTLSLEPENRNMNGDINQALIDYMRIVKVD